MIEFDGEKRILSWGNCSDEELQKLGAIQLETHMSRFGVSNWKWDTYPEGEPYYCPAEYTPGQLEQLRNEYVRSEIEKLYPPDIQLKILTEKDEKPEAYNTMQEARQRIKAESKKIDFQITDGGVK